jgi:hypothetical protein
MGRVIVAWIHWQNIMYNKLLAIIAYTTTTTTACLRFAKYMQCPGCDRAFVVGHSMFQHLAHSLECKAFINSSSSLVNNNAAVCTAGLHTPPILDMDESVSGTESMPVFDKYDSSPPGSAIDPLFNDEEWLPDPLLNVDYNLQDTVLFPLAFTNNLAFHEVQLFKLLHNIGAPNYTFQSFMEWGRNCSRDEYHFQPCPQRYEV